MVPAVLRVLCPRALEPAMLSIGARRRRGAAAAKEPQPCPDFELLELDMQAWTRGAVDELAAEAGMAARWSNDDGDDDGDDDDAAASSNNGGDGRVVVVVVQEGSEAAPPPQQHDAPACRHVWECLRGRTHNRGKGKYKAYRCRECGAFQRRG